MYTNCHKDFIFHGTTAPAAANKIFSTNEIDYHNGGFNSNLFLEQCNKQTDFRNPLMKSAIC